VGVITLPGGIRIAVTVQELMVNSPRGPRQFFSHQNITYSLGYIVACTRNTRNARRGHTLCDKNVQEVTVNGELVFERQINLFLCT
jgi:hypothetical protein